MRDGRTFGQQADRTARMAWASPIDRNHRVEPEHPQSGKVVMADDIAIAHTPPDGSGDAFPEPVLAPSPSVSAVRHLDGADR